MSSELENASIEEREESINKLKNTLDKLYLIVIKALADLMPQCAKNEIDRRVNSCWREVKTLDASGNLKKLKTNIKTYLESLNSETLKLSKSAEYYPHMFKNNEYKHNNQNQIDVDVNTIFKTVMKDLDSNLASYGLLRDNRANRMEYPDHSDILNFRNIANIDKIEALEKAIEKYKASYTLLINKCDDLRNYKIKLEKDEVMKSWNDGNI